MSKKKNNHYSPKLILRKWQTFEENRWGVHLYDLIKDKYSFSSSTGSGAFSFASKNYLYVPDVDGQRKVNVEEWLSGIESTLASTILKIEKEENTPLFSNIDDMMKFVLALISFKHRNEYELKIIRKKLEGDKELQFNISGIPNRDINLVVLENMINVCYEDFHKYSQFKLIIFTCSSHKSLIYCDRPFLDDVIDGYSFIPITNKKFIAIRPIDTQSVFSYDRCSDNLIDTVNLILADRSRNWIIADSKELLDRYTEVAKSSNHDIEPVYVPVKYLKSGNIIK